MAELLKDLDMYVPGAGGFDVGLHAQTGHPCAVVPYKFDSPPAGRGGGGRGAAPDTTGGRGAPPAEQVVYNKQPICAVLAGNLYNDDKILSVAHQHQIPHGVAICSIRSSGELAAVLARSAVILSEAKDLSSQTGNQNRTGRSFTRLRSSG
jgi:hypothetical protein